MKDSEDIVSAKQSRANVLSFLYSSHTPAACDRRLPYSFSTHSRLPGSQVNRGFAIKICDVIEHSTLNG